MTKYRTQVSKYQMAYQFCDSPSDEVVVFIHGIPTNSHLWDEVIPYLVNDYKVLAIDMIGYGDSERAPYYDLTLPKQANYLIELLNKLGIQNAHFVGHDLGGGVVQLLATLYANRVKSFVIADGVTFSNWPLPKVVSLCWPTAEIFEPSTAFIERMIREGVYHPKVVTPSVVNRFTLPFSDQNGPEALQQAALALDHHQTENLVPYLPQVNIPATLLWGQYDHYLPPYWGNLLSQTLPRANFKLLKNCSHYSMLDNPSLFATELLTHLHNNRQ